MLYFNPRPPRGGRPPIHRGGRGGETDFNPRPPRGGRRLGNCLPHRPLVISIHALREEGDCMSAVWTTTRSNFNPRPPRGGRLILMYRLTMTSVFQSTPSARRATDHLAGAREVGVISIHALREEGDLTGKRERLELYLFQSTPSARRATPHLCPEILPVRISIHALREEGDEVGISTE